MKRIVKKVWVRELLRRRCRLSLPAIVAVSSSPNVDGIKSTFVTVKNEKRHSSSSHTLARLYAGDENGCRGKKNGKMWRKRRARAHAGIERDGGERRKTWKTCALMEMREKHVWVRERRKKREMEAENFQIDICFSRFLRLYRFEWQNKNAQKVWENVDSVKKEFSSEKNGQRLCQIKSTSEPFSFPFRWLFFSSDETWIVSKDRESVDLQQQNNQHIMRLIFEQHFQGVFSLLLFRLVSFSRWGL